MLRLVRFTTAQVSSFSKNHVFSKKLHTVSCRLKPSPLDQAKMQNSLDQAKIDEKIAEQKEKDTRKKFGAMLFGLGASVWYAYTRYEENKFKSDAITIFNDASERLNKLPGMENTTFHTDIDDKNSTANPMHMSSYSEKLNTDFIRVMFFASMNNREAVIITEYAKHRTNGHLIPRIIMATIDPNTDYEKTKILEDNRKQTDGDENLGVIAGDEVPDDQLALVEEKTWESLTQIEREVPKM